MPIDPGAILALLADLQNRIAQVTTERDQLAQALHQRGVESPD